MSHTVASTLVDVLEKVGVKPIFGLIGDSLNPLVDALCHTKIEWIGVRNEEGAALAAADQAKLVDAENTNAAGESAATVAPQLVPQIEDAPARSIAPNISLRQSRRDALSMMAATAVCSIATEGIAASPASGAERDASTAGMSPARLQASQNAANSAPGPRFVPGRSIPVPTTASPEFQQTIAAPYRIPAWDADPKTSAEWKVLVDRLADETVVQTRKVRDRLGVTLESTVIDGVKAFVLTPKTVTASNRNRLLVHIHGGGYVYNPGEAATLEAALMAGYGGFKVISVDYRMPPDYPFPAGLDDAMRVWKSALKMHDPRNMAIFGSSAGAGMILAMMLRAKAEGLSLPAALGTGTPWANLAESGDTSKTNEWLDNVLVSYSGYLGRAARLYANGRPLTDPLISPIVGDFRNFPPSILTSGTRDLLLSLTVLTHRKLRQAGVEAYLQVFEGMSHFQFILDTESPESKEAFTEIARFFNRHLAT